MNKETAITLGVFIAPAVPAIINALMTDISLGSLALFPIFYVFSMMFMAIFGVPLIFIGINWNLVRWWSAAIAGACVGAIVGFVLGGQHAMNVIWPSAFGILEGLTFWFIYRFSRNEKSDGKSEPPTQI